MRPIDADELSKFVMEVFCRSDERHPNESKVIQMLLDKYTDLIFDFIDGAPTLTNEQLKEYLGGNKND